MWKQNKKGKGGGGGGDKTYIKYQSKKFCKWFTYRNGRSFQKCLQTTLTIMRIIFVLSKISPDLKLYILNLKTEEVIKIRMSYKKLRELKASMT